MAGNLRTMGNVWLASGGAYLILALEFLGCAGFYIALGFRMGKSIQSDGDGCLYAMCNLFMTAAGLGIGYWLAPYPYYLLSAFFGMLILPAVGSRILIRRAR